MISFLISGYVCLTLPKATLGIRWKSLLPGNERNTLEEFKLLNNFLSASIQHGETISFCTRLRNEVLEDDSPDYRSASPGYIVLKNKQDYLKMQCDLVSQQLDIKAIMIMLAEDLKESIEWKTLLSVIVDIDCLVFLCFEDSFHRPTKPNSDVQIVKTLLSGR